MAHELTAETAILQLGDPRLRQIAAPVETVNDPHVQADGQRVWQALQAFRAEHGFGRATAAPQLGIQRRMIALCLPDWPSLLINPDIIWRSETTVTLWDDCMCFPSLLVRVQRAASISVRFLDQNGIPHERHELNTATAELLQHEIDHLDGILAVDRAIGPEPLVSRVTFEQQRDFFLQQVNFVSA